MFDIHTHILPGIDDGSPDLQTSLKMAAIAAQNGTQVIVATPHTNRGNCLRRRFENLFSPELLKSYRDFVKALQEAKIPVQVLLGQEVYASEDLYDKIMDRKVIGLNNSDYMLTEFSFSAEEDRIAHGLAEVRRAGKKPILAHPERYESVIDDPDMVLRLAEEGCLVQINSSSFLGDFGPDVMEVAEYLVEKKVVTCIASDAHDTINRMPVLYDVRRKLENMDEDAVARALLHSNPKRIVSNKALR